MKFENKTLNILAAILSFILVSCSTNNWNENVIDFGSSISFQSRIYKVDFKTDSFSVSKQSDLHNVRSKYLLEGLIATRLQFDAQVENGNYKVISYFEAGLTDSIYLKYFLNEEEQKIEWQSFDPPAEPRNQIQKVYRSVSSDVNVNYKIIPVKLVGVKDSVRILAMMLFRNDNESLEPTGPLASKLNEIGRYDSPNDPAEIDEVLRILAGNNDYINYWNVRLNEFRLAIELFNAIGWESASKKYEMGIFDRLFQCVMLLDGIISDPLTEKYLGEKARWIRGRVLWWLDMERGGTGESFAAQRDIKYMLNIHPHDNLIRMYAGERIDLPDKCDSIYISPNAPQWSKLAREALARLLSEIEWWVNIRQAPNGELGGKIGDDVEILRWWSGLAAFGDGNAITGWKKLTGAVWNNPKVYKGYSRRPLDVEHAAEFISDAFPELVYFSDDESLEYLKPSVDYFSELWTFKNKNGRRFFKSSWFSSTEVITEPPKDRDLAMNTRATKAVRFYSWKSGDEDINTKLYEWSLAWKDMAMRSDKGKPVGVFPASVRGVDESFNGDGNNWYEANMYWSYYDWKGSGSVRFYDQLLFSYLTNGDVSLLEPIKLTLQMIKKYGKQESALEGTEAWAVKIISENYGFWNVVLQYRIFTGDKSFDQLISRYGNPYSKYLLSGDSSLLEIGLNKLLKDIRYNTPLRTSEVIHTDRVRTFDIITLKGMLTGNDSYELESPFLWVTYENTNSKFTPLVTSVATNKISLSVFYHSSESAEPIIRLWNMDKGKYSLKIIDDSDLVIFETSLDYTLQGERIKLNIPGEKLLHITIEKI